ncbi:MAG: ATP synthase subunit I [Thermoguttaceae bacterium]|jgi:F1F0 ATPase subunit 2|nr:ATP synthase subunit I [Thermoguttaceae bacterium]
MATNDVITLVLAGGAGVVLGAAFFGGLWWTVRRGLSAKRPAVWFLGSFLVRAAILLAGFWLVAGGHWDRLLACLFGFFIARFLATLLTGTMSACRNAPTEETGHAS